MKARTKGKEIMKVAAVCILSISLFSAAFVGFNQLIFAAAISEAMPLPVIETAANLTQDPSPAPVSASAPASDPISVPEQSQPEEEPAVFTPPRLTIIESPYQHFHSVPASALSMEDAAQIGARYIWDVFGTDMDGIYVQLMFAAHASQINTWWVGNVFTENPDNPTQNYLVHPSDGIKTALPVYAFVINGITGERIDIRYMGQQGRVSPAAHGNINRSAVSARMALVESGWFDMDIYEQLAFAGISDSALESYIQTATRLAQAHFNVSGVSSDAHLVSLGVHGMTDGVVDIGSLNFAVLDNTGREAGITIPTTNAGSRSMSISTQHNDFVPGFSYDAPGRG